MKHLFHTSGGASQKKKIIRVGVGWLYEGEGVFQGNLRVRRRRRRFSFNFFYIFLYPLIVQFIYAIPKLTRVLERFLRWTYTSEPD